VNIPKATTHPDLNTIYSNLPFVMEKVAEPVFPDRRVSIIDFGAVSDGRKLNTEAITKAINQVSELGGGTVVIPEGLWLTGPIELKSNVCLQTSKGTLVLFTRDFSQYPMVRTYYEGMEGWRTMSPIYARNATNIAIKGEGLFDGNGDAWRPVKKNNVTTFQWREFVASGGVLSSDEATWYPTPSALKGSLDKTLPKARTMDEALGIKEFLRPVMVNLIPCKNIQLEGISFRNSPEQIFILGKKQ
jgi:polygalacturonase